MSKRELQYASGWAAVLMLLSCLPYAVVWWYAPLGSVFPGTLFTSDDHGVYFSWMRQAADGQVLFRNLFTTEPQSARHFHAFFLVLGWLSRVPGLDIPTAYHLGRVVSGIVALVLIYRLGCVFSADLFTRRCIFWTAALSSGLGWLFWQDHIRDHWNPPVDVWQPEALISTSLYVNAMYAASLALMVGCVLCLLRAEERGWKWAVGAGVCGLLLGNIHSYDVIHLAAAWTAYLATRWVVERRFPGRALGMALIAAVVALPSVLYMAWLYVSEPVFKARADTATLSPHPLRYVLGFGLVLPLAAWGAVLLARRKSEEKGPAWLLPAAWTVAGFLVAYAPFAFQRKMIMGTHVPLALLAGLAVAHLARSVHARLRLPTFITAAAVVGLMSITTVRWLVRDTRLALNENLTSTLSHPAYWPSSLIQAFEWIRERSATPGGAVLTFPPNGVLAPAYTGRRVWSGHWGETPGYPETFDAARRFYWGSMSSPERADFLRHSGIRYVVHSPLEQVYTQLWAEHRRAKGLPLPIHRPLAAEPFLKAAFRSEEADPQQPETVVYLFAPPGS